MGKVKLPNKHKIYWSHEQFKVIKELLVDDETRYRTRFGWKPKRPLPPRLSDEGRFLLRPDPQSGAERIEGQWEALQHQLGNKPFQATLQPLTWNAENGHYMGTSKRMRKQALLQRGLRDWYVHSVGGIFMAYETLPEESSDHPPVPAARVQDRFHLGRPAPENVSSSWNSFPVWSAEKSFSVAPGQLQVTSGRGESQKQLVPGVVPGKTSLVFDALYEAVRPGWNSATLEKLERLKPGVIHPHQVSLVLKKLAGRGALALEFFTWAKTIPGFRHDAVNYSTMIMILGDDGNFPMAENLFLEMQEVGVPLDTFTINNMIRCYLKVNRVDEALDLYRKMPFFGCRPDNCTFGLLIGWCGKFGNKKELQRLFMDLRASPHNADTQTFNIMISNFSKQRDFINARQAVTQMRQWGLELTIASYSIIIYMYGKAEDSQAAGAVYQEYLSSGLKPSLIVYNNAALSYGISGRLLEAEQVVSDMQRAGLEPDRYTYCTLISSWGRNGRLNEAQEWFDQAIRRGVCPSLEMCNALIDGYLKVNKPEPARDVLMELMPKWGVKPSLETYVLLLRRFTEAKVTSSRIIRELMRKTNLPAEEFFSSVADPPQRVELQQLRRISLEFFERTRGENPRWGRWLGDAVVNHLHLFGLVREAYLVFQGLSSSGLYPRGIWEDWKDAWFIWLQEMSLGTALVGLMNGLMISKKRLRRGFERPEKVIIICGYDTKKSVEVTRTVYKFLQVLDSPFEPFIEFGRFMCEGNLFREWLQEDKVAREFNMV